MVEKRIRALEQEIEEIRTRNKMVGADKAWETSNFRKVLVATFTYLTIGFYLQVIGVSEPWLNAIVPAAAFMLSTATLPYFKKIWVKYRYKKSNQ